MFQDGFWEVGDLPVIGINTNSFIDLLKSAGAMSLGKSNSVTKMVEQCKSM